MKVTVGLRVIVLLALATFAAAAQEPKFSQPNRVPADAAPISHDVEPMNPQEPMPAGMAKPGMKKGDVLKEEQQKKRYMERMMREEKTPTEPRDR